MKIEFYIDFIKWFSCVCLHMGQKTSTNLSFFHLFAHVGPSLSSIDGPIIARIGPFVDSQAQIFAKFLVLPAHKTQKKALPKCIGRTAFIWVDSDKCERSVRRPVFCTRWPFAKPASTAGSFLRQSGCCNCPVYAGWPG